MLSKKELELIRTYLLDLENVQVDYPFSSTLAVYQVNQVAFAYLETAKALWSISLRSDPLLAKVLRDKYDEVLSGYKLNPKIWITIVISGQLNFSELTGLIDHSYQLARETNL